MATDSPRPSFYALAPGGWRDYLTLLHPPYTAWHLSYVVIGAALAPEFAVSRLIPTLVAFFLAVGVGAHALDELSGRPSAHGDSGADPRRRSALSIGAAAAIGIFGAVTVDPWIGAFVAAGVFIVCAYNLELAGGRFHSDAWFAIAWGGFPLLTAYFAAAETIRLEAVLGALFASALSLAQRYLSTQVRYVRRDVVAVSGSLEHGDGGAEPVTRETLIDAHERALRALAFACVSLAGALLALRLA